MSVRAAAAIALLLAGGLLSGCGTKGRTAVIADGHHELRLSLDEFNIRPRHSSVPPGRLKIVVRNDGVLTHNLVIVRGHRDAAGGDVVASIPTMQPGATGGPIKVALPPGEYTLMSTIMTQADLGMIATLRIR